MPCAEDIDAIVREMNLLLDEQLAFLGGDLRALDSAAWQQYEFRYRRIHVLCELLGGESENSCALEKEAAASA